MDLDNIITLINTVSKSQLSSFTLEEGDMKLSLEANRQVSFAGGNTLVDTKVVSDNVNSAIDQIREISVGKEVKSPLVGTFYAAKSEGEEPFVKAGDKVKKGQVIGIIEAMKLMNEVECDYDGVVEKVLVDNEEMVEYGQPLVSIV